MSTTELLRHAPDRRIAERLLQHHLPLKSYLVANKPRFAIQTRVNSLDETRVYDTLCPNTHAYMNVIAVDIDSPNALRECYDINDHDSRLVPNLVMVNRADDIAGWRPARPGHAHAIYILDQAINRTTRAGNDFAVDLRKRAQQFIQHSDAGYKNFFVKNPLSARWHTHVLNDRPHSPSDLGQLFPSLQVGVRDSELEIVPGALDRELSFMEGTRNTDVFDVVRLWAYDNWAHYAAADEWHRAVLNQCRITNLRCEPPLSDGEMRSTARSIASWCWRYQPKPKRFDPSWQIGRLQLRGSAMPMRDRRSLAAYATHKLRRIRSHNLVLNARAANPSGLMSEIAWLCGLDKRTVSRYWSETCPAESCPESNALCVADLESNALCAADLESNALCAADLCDPPGLQDEASKEESKQGRALTNLISIMLDQTEPVQSQTEPAQPTAKVRDKLDALKPFLHLSERQLSKLSGLSRNTIAKWRHYMVKNKVKKQQTKLDPAVDPMPATDGVWRLSERHNRYIVFPYGVAHAVVYQHAKDGDWKMRFTEKRAAAIITSHATQQDAEDAATAAYLSMNSGTASTQ